MNLIRIVQVPVLLRRHERKVRLEKANRQEERRPLFLHASQVGDGALMPAVPEHVRAQLDRAGCGWGYLHVAGLVAALGQEYGANPDRFEKDPSFSIHCGLCVRYCAQVVEKHAVGFIDRGIRKEICLAYVPDVEIGDYVIVHVGFAISRVDEEEARRTFELLEEISELDELEWMKEVAEQSLSVLESGKDASPPAAPDPTPSTGPS